MKLKYIILCAIGVFTFINCNETPKQEDSKIKKIEISEEDKALEKEMEELDEDIETLETIKK
jgi:hypothetical protein